MTKTLYLTVFLAVVLFSGCYSPVIQTYDSARMVSKDEIEVRANYSNYTTSSDYTVPPLNLLDLSYKNNNYGLTAVYGLKDKINLGVRYEYIAVQPPPLDSLNSDFIISAVDFLNTDRVHFFQITPKFSLKQDKIAFSAPIGMYRSPLNLEPLLDTTLTATSYEFKPSFHFTFGNQKNTFDASIIPQGIFLLGNNSVVFAPSLGIGLGFSSDLDKWAIRPEISYNLLTIAVGVSGSYRFNVGRKKR